MPKIDIPIGENGQKDYTAEAQRLTQLIYQPDRTNKGNVEFISTTSGESYNTSNYQDDPEIYNKGDVGLIRLFQKRLGGPDGFLLLAEDYNRLTPIHITVVLNADRWEEVAKNSVYKQSYSDDYIRATSHINLEATVEEYQIHENEPYCTIVVDNVKDGSCDIYFMGTTAPTSDYKIKLSIAG